MMIASAITAATAMGYIPPFPARNRAAIWSEKEPEAVASAASSVSWVRNPAVIDGLRTGQQSAAGGAAGSRAEPWNVQGMEGASYVPHSPTCQESGVGKYAQPLHIFGPRDSCTAVRLYPFDGATPSSSEARSRSRIRASPT